MSASSKKKIRKEQNAAIMTERQQREQAEAKKLKVTTLTFIGIISAILCLAIVVGIISVIGMFGWVGQWNTVATVGEHEISLTEFNYYYYDQVNNSYSQVMSEAEQMAEYLNMSAEEFLLEYSGLDLSKPLTESIYDPNTGDTWADFMIQQTLSKIQHDYALYDAAIAAGYELTQEDKDTIDNYVSNIKSLAPYYSVDGSVKGYLRQMYGDYANEKSFRAYMERSLVAEGYYNQYKDSLNFSSDDLREYEGDNKINYNSYSYAYYTLNVVDYHAFVNPVTVTPDDAAESDGETVVTEYTPEQKEAARKEAEADANVLAAATTLEEMNEAIVALRQNKDKTSASAIESKNVLYSAAKTEFREWLIEEGREVGNTMILPIESEVETEETEETESTEESEETKETEITGYYVVMYLGSTDNTELMSNVRHILVAPEEGEDEEANDAAAKEKAEKLLQTWKDGAADDASFAALVHDNTDDEGSAETGGLYENIHAGSSYVAEFLSWSTDPNRKENDAEVIKTEYGYHVMYYVGKSDISYRDQMVTDELLTETMDNWYAEIVEGYDITNQNTKRVETDLVLG